MFSTQCDFTAERFQRLAGGKCSGCDAPPLDTTCVSGRQVSKGLPTMHSVGG